MEIRGERECRDCGTRWSYYDTGSVACPACGSLVSVGVDDRQRHTDAPAELDLSAHRRTADTDGVVAAAAEVGPDLTSYRSRRGFLGGGDLLPLDDTYLAAGELRHAADAVDRRGSVTEDEEVYLLALLTGAERGERPAPDDVPGSLASSRALAYADAVLDYRSEVVTYLRDVAEDEGPRRTLGRVAERAKRVRAIDGDVPVEEAETLVAATRDVTAALDGADGALARANDRLDALD
ncbi:MAG: hypothetical protein ABEJ43_09580 [Haloferacaceae archaeon]